MSGPLAIDFIRHAIYTALMVAAPLLITALLVGVVVSLIQAVTQLQEQTLTFIPKLIAVTGMFIFLLPWMLSQLTGYLTTVLRSLPALGR